jgi:3-deoxy-manno-octulosonate cytidylyltransferase (CMP-KDO synthetase)
MGLYAFRMNTLKQLMIQRPSRLETIERLEQLRLLENSIPIHVVVTDHRSIGVDRPEDIETVSKIIVQKHGSKPPYPLP